MKTALPRLYIFDGLRGICAALVTLRHEVPLWGFEPFFRTYLAVDLFFIMSGYVIAANYFDALSSGRMSVGSFIKVRLIRFLPVYWLSLAIILAFRWLMPAEGAAAISLGSVLREALLIPDLISGKSLFHLNGVAWTLFFELLLNIVYAVVVVQKSGRILNHILIALFGVVVVRMCLWYGTADRGAAFTLSSFAMGIGRSGFGIFIGALLANWAKTSTWLQRRSSSVSWLAAAIAIGAILTPSFGVRWDGVIDGLLIAFAFPLLIFLMASNTPSKGAAFALQALGAASYPLYLLHGVAALFVAKAWPSLFPSPALAFIFSVLLFLCCWAVDHYFDGPTRRFLKSNLQMAKIPKISNIPRN